MEVFLASPPYLQHIYLQRLVKLTVNHLVVNKKIYSAFKDAIYALNNIASIFKLISG
jgi:hypothetical protein